jgi:hypothetical protein
MVARGHLTTLLREKLARLCGDSRPHWVQTEKAKIPSCKIRQYNIWSPAYSRVNLYDIFPFIHFRCPAGYYEGFDNTTHTSLRTCFNVSECLSNPCLHGACFDRVNDYHCECEYGWEGKNCGQRQEKIVAALSTGALVAILVCLFLLMCKYNNDIISNCALFVT